jgi:hypothetical protein
MAGEGWMSEKLRRKDPQDQFTLDEKRILTPEWYLELKKMLVNLTTKFDGLEKRIKKLEGGE